MDSQERLQKQFAFLREIDREKQVVRRTPLADNSRMENDAEHAWHMAVMALLTAEYANEEIDLLRTISMILIHDLVEIYSGDTYAYDEKAKESQRERELAAADRLFALLPEDQGKQFRALWEEFEAHETPEAKFAKTLDNVQPTMLNDASHGTSWISHGIRLSQILKRNSVTKDGSEALWNYSYQNFILPSVEKGYIIKDAET